MAPRYQVPICPDSVSKKRQRAIETGTLSIQMLSLQALSIAPRLVGWRRPDAERRRRRRDERQAIGSTIAARAGYIAQPLRQNAYLIPNCIMRGSPF